MNPIDASEIRWAEPFWFVLLALIPLPWLLDWLRSPRRLRWPALDGLPPRLRARWRWALPWLIRALMIAAIATAMARPQGVAGITRIRSRGVSIVVALDRSRSMATPDFAGFDSDAPTTRLEAAQQTLIQFIEGRPDDLLGLIAFADLPEIRWPPTLDHDLLIEVAGVIEPAGADESGTDLGAAIVSGLRALRDVETDQRVLVLLTDGRHEPPGGREVIAPTDAARLARQLDVVLHTIALGRPGPIRQTLPGSEGLEVVLDDQGGPDVGLLDRLARLGGGQAFRAEDRDALRDVFDALDVLQRSQIEDIVRTRYDERFHSWVLLALALLTLDRILAATILRKIP